MLRPRLDRRLGQHHLVSGALCRPLVDFLAPAGARVLEIGPGGGVLTAELLAAGARVLAVELDPAWSFELARRLAGARSAGAQSTDARSGGPQSTGARSGGPQSIGARSGGPQSIGARSGGPRLAIAVADALEIGWHRLPAPTLVAGNLPYNVATAIVARLLPQAERVPRAAFLVQKEVAERLVAAPGDSAYGALSVLVAARAEVRLLGRVRPGSFRPPPKVESAFVGLRLHPPPLPEAEMGGLEATVRLAFGQRRKTLRNALAAGWGRTLAEEVLAALGWPLATRAESLPLSAFLALHAGARARRAPVGVDDVKW